ncbi:helix-turn-helix domain-containing protein [Streptomyces sp. NPDC000941]
MGGLRRGVCPERTWETVAARPHPRLRPGVHGYRGFRMALGRPRRRLELPIGAVTLMLGFQGSLRISDPTRPSSAADFTSVLMGLGTHAGQGEHNGSLYGVEVVLEPWVAFTLFGVAMHELAETVIPPGELLGPRIHDLTDALAALPGWPERFQLLDTVLPAWAAGGPPCAPPVVAAWRELVRTGGTVPIRRLTALTGWGSRTLEKRFREQIGLPPKTAARVLRLRRALRLLARGCVPAQVAAASGYCDQAHFTRECTAMTGLPPRRLHLARTASTTALMAHDRMRGEVTSIVLTDQRPSR